MVTQHLRHRRLASEYKLYDEVGAPGMKKIIILVETQPFETGTNDCLLQAPVRWKQEQALLYFRGKIPSD